MEIKSIDPYEEIEKLKKTINSLEKNKSTVEISITWALFNNFIEYDGT